MKRTLLTILTLLTVSGFLAAPQIDAATTINYAASGDTLIATQTADINTFVMLYNKDKGYFTGIQKQQVESQYNSLLTSLKTIKTNLSNDPLTQQETDYNDIAQLYVEEQGIPMLYSELFLFKADYLFTVIGKMNTQLLPEVVNGISGTQHQQALTIASAVSQEYTQMNQAQQNIQTDYSKIVDEEGAASSNKAPAYKALFADIKTNQQLILSRIQSFDTTITTLTSMY